MQSFAKLLYALTEVLKNLHTHCEKTVHAYHRNILKIRIQNRPQRLYSLEIVISIKLIT